MRGSEHESGAASAAPETTPTIGQRPVPVCLQCVTGGGRFVWSSAYMRRWSMPRGRRRLSGVGR